MTIDFPLSPSNGENYMYNNIVYTFDGIKWIASAHLDNSGVIEGVTKAGDTMTGGLKIDDGAIDGIELNENGSASFTGTVTSADTEEADVDGTLTTKQYIDDSISALMTDVSALEPSFPPPWELPWVPTEWGHYGSPGPEEWLDTIAHGGGKFVVLGRTTPITIDDDFSGDWVAGTTLPYGIWQAMAEKDGKFVAISVRWQGPNYNPSLGQASNDTYNQVMHSTDGLTWTSARQASDNVYWRSIAASNTRFVVGGLRTIIWSYNGIDWYPSVNVPSGASNYHTLLAYGGNKFIVSADYTKGSPLWWSPSGYNWYEGNPLPSGFEDFQPGAAVYAQDKWLVKGIGYGTGSVQLLTSTDAINWTEAEEYEGIRDGPLTYFNGQFIIIAGDQSGYVAYSSDGTRWTSKYVGLRASTWKDTAVGNGRLVAISSHTRRSDGTRTVPVRPIAMTDPL